MNVISINKLFHIRKKIRFALPFYYSKFTVLVTNSGNNKLVIVLTASNLVFKFFLINIIMYILQVLLMEIFIHCQYVVTSYIWSSTRERKVMSMDSKISQVAISTLRSVMSSFPLWEMEWWKWMATLVVWIYGDFPT